MAQELKAGVLVTPHNEGMCFHRGSDSIGVTENETEFYLKSEADKVIRHHKYKRCLNNAWWLLREEFFAEDCHCEHWVDWAIKWEKRWLELAEKFKEAK